MATPLDRATASALVAFASRLIASPQNLTAIRDLDEAVDRHLSDSLAVASLPLVDGPICDIGSGGGAPGLVMAYLMPDRPLTLVESERRKADWLEDEASDLPRVTVVGARTEEFATHAREQFAVVTARAVAPPRSVLELAAPLVAVGGQFVVWTSVDAADEWAEAQPVAAHLGFGSADVYDVTPFAHARRRLVLFPKHEATPATYPRRPGRATKRPLDPGRLQTT